MGIYERDYYRQERSGIHLRLPTTIIGLVILINVALWLADGLFTPETRAISHTLAVTPSSLTRPWLWWQFLTYGFVHHPQLWHVFGNMLGLWFLGREVELLYGRNEFLRLYLVLLAAGSLVWVLVSRLQGIPGGYLLGASGAVVGVVLLFALNFPQRTILFMFVIPMPAWVLGVIVIIGDLYGMLARADTQVAYVVHLTGAAFAFLYYRFQWHLGNWVPGTRWFRSRGSLRTQFRPKLKIHDPSDEQDRLSEEVDRILEKISREGETSLTRKERRTLENASREYQKRRHADQDSP